jgi:hypothetical protein
MSDAATPLIEPSEARALLQRELEVLGELADLGLAMARTIVTQATGEATTAPIIQGDLPLAFSRVSRAVRMAVLLQSRLIHGPEDKGRKTASDEEEFDGPDKWEVYWLDSDGNPVRGKTHDQDETSTERLEAERAERPEPDDIYAAVIGRPKEAVIAEIRSDLGLEPEGHIKARPPSPAAGDGDREAVVGAGQAHHPSASPITDSS